MFSIFSLGLVGRSRIDRGLFWCDLGAVAVVWVVNMWGFGARPFRNWLGVLFRPGDLSAKNVFLDDFSKISHPRKGGFPLKCVPQPPLEVSSAGIYLSAANS